MHAPRVLPISPLVHVLRRVLFVCVRVCCLPHLHHRQAKHFISCGAFCVSGKVGRFVCLCVCVSFIQPRQQPMPMQLTRCERLVDMAVLMRQPWEAAARLLASAAAAAHRAAVAATAAGQLYCR